jgi:uncharacterized protein (UPF0276 family)
MRDFPHLGHGVGLRPQHYPEVLDGQARADWFEVISENFMVRGGPPLRNLERARERAPIVLHGVSMNLGGTSPLDADHLDALAALADRFTPAWLSEHLCWGAVGRHYAHDLLPLPYTEEALAQVVERIRRVQDRLRRRILIENVSSYVTYRHSVMPEGTFLGAVAEAADCGILLDVNNVYVSAVNHGFAPEDYLLGLPLDRVGQIHLAGHTDAGTHLIDTHDHPVPDAVWDLYRLAVRRFGPTATLVEWDDRIPSFAELAAEAELARAIEKDELSLLAA